MIMACAARAITLLRLLAAVVLDRHQGVADRGRQLESRRGVFVVPGEDQLVADQSRKDETKMVNIIEVGLFVLKRHLNLLIFRHRGTSSGPFLSSWRSL